MIDVLDKDDVVALMDDKEEEKKEEEVKDDQVQGRQAEIYKIDMDHASKILIQLFLLLSHKFLLLLQQLLPHAAASTKRRKGVVIRDPEEESTTIIPADTKSKDKGKGIMQKAKEDPAVKRYQAMKRKPLTKAQAQRNMIMYLKNVAGFRLDYFKGMSYDDILLIFQVKFNSNVDFILKTKEQMEEEERRSIQSIKETPAQKAAKRRKLNEEVEDLKRHLEIVLNEDDDV
nr:hypothetical protein [Tanacetum cinerariifolium]